jgi:hypothetical protein
MRKRVSNSFLRPAAFWRSAFLGTIVLTVGGCASRAEGTAEPGPESEPTSWAATIEDRRFPISKIAIPELAPEDIFLVPGTENANKDQCNGQPGRTDVVSGSVYFFGYWGDWGCMNECLPGSYAYAVSVKSEPPQGSGDDTAANGVRLDCYHKYGDVNGKAIYTGSITSTVQKWGSWSPAKVCSTLNNPINGQEIKVEPKQGRDDDTALNNVAVHCKGEGWKIPTVPTSWGNWWTGGLCGDPNAAVCGLRTQVEPSQAGNDDTALNATSMICCTF